VRGDGVVITDYKTMGDGALRTLAGQAARGRAPQLALEASIAIASGFPGLDTMHVAGLRYISASGGEPPGVELAIKAEDVSLLAKREREGLETLIADFNRQDTPYKALRRAGFSYEYDDYAHLARVDEWSGSGDAGEGA
jgi:ATP-dependent helicase/nuclease subunit B